MVLLSILPFLIPRTEIIVWSSSNTLFRGGVGPWYFFPWLSLSVH